MRIAGWAPIAAFVLIPLCASADEKATSVVAKDMSGASLARVHGNLAADAPKTTAGQRDVAVTDKPTAAPKTTERPAPTPRMLRKMNTDHAMAEIDPAVRACAPQNPTNAPLSFGMRVVVAPNGGVESSDLAAGASAPPPVVVCVAAAVKTAHFGSPGPNGATIALPITVPGRPAPPAKR